MSLPLADASRRRLRDGELRISFVKQENSGKKLNKRLKLSKKAQAATEMVEPTGTIPELAEPYVVVSKAEARLAMKEMEISVSPKMLLPQKEVIESEMMSVRACSAEIVPSTSKLPSPSIMQTRGRRKRWLETTKVRKEPRIRSTKITDTPLKTIIEVPANPTASKESTGKKKVVVEKRSKTKLILDPKMTRVPKKESNHEETSQETLDRLMGPIRAIMNKRAEELSSEISREKESIRSEIEPAAEIEASGITDTAPPTTQIITSATDEPTVALSTEMTVELTQPEENPPSATVETNLDLAQSKEKTVVKTSGPSASVKKRKKYILKRKADVTKHSMSLRIKELEDVCKKLEADIMKLFGFLNAEVEKTGKLSSELNRVRIDGSANNSRILEVTRQMTDIQDKMNVDFHMNSKEFASMKEKINDLNAKCFQQTDTRIPSSQLPADIHGEAPGTTNPHSRMITIPKTDLYKMYKQGYEEALIKVARLGYLHEDVLYNKAVILPGFDRFEELRYYVMTSTRESQSTQRNMRRPSHTFEDQGRGKY